MSRQSLVHRIGRRGAALLFLAQLDFIYALSLFRPASEARLSPTLAFIREVAPLPVWAALWLGVGLACLAGAFARRDRWAFTAAVALKVLWGSVFLFGWLIAGLDRGWTAAVIWLAFAGWVLIIASWPEASVTVHIANEERR